MSGTSLDGIDLALCHFEGVHYQVLDATTVAYSPEWRQRLASVDRGSAFDYALTHVEYGHLLGRTVRSFLDGRDCNAVASHGHTVFHQPERGLTAQIGCPNAIAAECRLPVVADFRTLDVALGGQGAPLVPMGDQLLFPQYDACLNLGGIANISYGREIRTAFDICPCNMALNRIAQSIGRDYDPDGALARSGEVDHMLLRQLNALPYYHSPAPKSLGKEWFDKEFWPMVEQSKSTPESMLATCTRHTAQMIAEVITTEQIASVLVTGGGTHNGFLIETLRALAPQCSITVPDQLTIDFKEAIVFAFLGYRRLCNATNTLKSVTGAARNSSGGVVSGVLC